MNNPEPALDPYIILLAVTGVAVVATALLRRVVVGRALSLPMLYLATGMVLFALPGGLEGPRPGADAEEAERLTELIVIVSVMGAGLKLNRPLSRRSWNTTWRLVGLAMPLTIGATVVLGLGGLGMPLATALLLGAVVAPTDPVLASDVQVEGPAEDERDDGEVRFALTSEAGLNDAAAFPFTHLALAVAGGGAWLTDWVVHDVAIRLTVGVIAGVVLGRIVAWLMFSVRPGAALATTSEGFVVLGTTLAVYALTELAHGYGFLAVFVAGLTIRNQERDHEYHRVLHAAADTTEQVASVVFLLLLGGAVIDGGLAGLTPAGAAVAVALVVVVRPLAGWLSLLGSRLPADEKAAVSFLGLRGMGTVYYLSYAATEELFVRAAEVWAVALLVIVISIVLHGTTSTPVLRRLDQRRTRRTMLNGSGDGTAAHAVL